MICGVRHVMIYKDFFYLINSKMEILRTDGSGMNTEDKRLQRVRVLIQKLEIPKICLLQDHKGELSVYWVEHPKDEHMELVRLLWHLENEYCISHFLSPSNIPLK